MSPFGKASEKENPIVLKTCVESAKNAMIWGGRNSPAHSSWIARKIVNLISRLPQTSRSKPRVAGNGFKVTGDTSNVSFLLGYHEHKYMETLESKMKPKSTVLDIGANVGYLALWLLNSKRIANRVKIYGLEPEPDNFAWLQQNVALNSHLNLIPVPLALGTFDGKLELKSHGRGDGSARVLNCMETSNPVGMHVTKVDCRTLDSYCSDNQIRPDWLVLDVEGFAGEILKHGAATLKDCRPNVAVEIHGPEELDLVESCLAPAAYFPPLEIRSCWGCHLIWLKQN
jgi:FkbM family methyltransferase